MDKMQLSAMSAAGSREVPAKPPRRSGGARRRVAGELPASSPAGRSWQDGPHTYDSSRQACGGFLMLRTTAHTDTQTHMHTDMVAYHFGGGASLPPTARYKIPIAVRQKGQ